MLNTISFEVQVTVANEREHLKMVSWTVADLLGLILD